MKSLFGPGTFVLGGGAVLLAAFLVAGFLLPGRWTAEASIVLRAAPDEVLPFLESPEGWRRWTTWPDSGLVRSGPQQGAGASIAWEDEELGSGRFTIEHVADGPSVGYSVEVEGVAGSVMRTSGEVLGTETAAGLRVVWSEEGDLGRNPLMGFWALSMERAQGAEMAKSLDRLRELLSAVDTSASGQGVMKESTPDPEEGSGADSRR